MHLGEGERFPVSEVGLPEAVVDDDLASRGHDPGRFHSAPERAADDGVELVTGEPLAGLAGLSAADLA